MSTQIIKGKMSQDMIKEIWPTIKKQKNVLLIVEDSSLDLIEREKIKNGVVCTTVGANLLSEFLSDSTGVSKNVISEETQIMEIMRIMKLQNEEFIAFKNQSDNVGLVRNISSAINEFIESGLMPDELEDKLFSFQAALKDKLHDMLIIYRSLNDVFFRKQIKNRSELNMEVISKLKEVGENQLTFDHVVIAPLNTYSNFIIDFVDVYSTFDKDMKVLMYYSEDVFEYNYSLNKFNELVEKLQNNKSVDYYEIVESKAPLKLSDEIDQILMFKSKWEAISDYAYLFKGKNIFDEISLVAYKVKQLLNKGVKPGSIYIASTNTSAYQGILENIFLQENIPTYSKSRRSLKDTAVFKFSISLFELQKDPLNLLIVEKGLEALGYQAEASKVNVYYSRYGKELGRIETPMEEYLEVLGYRDMMLKIANQTTERVSDDTFNSLANALYLTLIENGVNERVVELANEVKDEHGQIYSEDIIGSWNTLIAVLREMKTIELSGVDNFINVLSFMGKTKEVKTTKEYGNAVKFTSMTEASNRNVDHLFVLGANEGSMPKYAKNLFVSDVEVQDLNYVMGRKILTESEENMHEESYQIYKTLTSSNEKVYISWKERELDGNELYSSNMIRPLIAAYSVNEFDRNDDIVKEILTMIREGGSHSKIQAMIDKAIKNPHNKSRLAKALNYLSVDKTQINAVNPAQVYTNKTFSVSRIESFYRCPFTYFIDYGLKPQEFEGIEETAATRGTFFHSVFEEYYAKYVKGKSKPYSEDYDRYLENITTIIDELKRTHNNGSLMLGKRFSVDFEIMRSKIVRSVFNSLVQLDAGDFEVLDMELEIGGKNAQIDGTLGDYVVRGFIDRVDFVEIDGDKYVRAIDFKSSAKTLNEKLLNEGKQIQLLLYAGFLIRKYKLAGLYYFHIRDPFNNEEEIDGTFNDIENFKLKGLTMSNDKIIRASDKKLSGDKNKSDIISVSYKKTGGLTSSSSVVEAEDLERMIKTAQDKFLEGVEKIMSGQTKASISKDSLFNTDKINRYKSIYHVDKGDSIKFVDKSENEEISFTLGEESGN